jgi:hypothetical protein
LNILDNATILIVVTCVSVTWTSEVVMMVILMLILVIAIVVVVVVDG